MSIVGGYGSSLTVIRQAKLRDVTVLMVALSPIRERKNDGRMMEELKQEIDDILVGSMYSFSEQREEVVEKIMTAVSAVIAQKDEHIRLLLRLLLTDPRRYL